MFGAELDRDRSKETVTSAPKKRKSTHGPVITPGNSNLVFPVNSQNQNSFTPLCNLYPKYSAGRPNGCISKLTNPSLILKNKSFIPPGTLLLKTQDLVAASISNSTWRNYSSALRSFQKFEVFSRVTYTWPLDIGAVRAYTSYALSEGKLAPASVINYLSAMRYIHLIKGFPAPHILQDDMIQILIRGAKNLSNPPSSNKRRVVSLPLLQALKEEIERSSWSLYLKTAVWALFSVAFFASARMGELVGPSRTSFDASSTLRVRDVLVRDSGIMIHLRRPKSGNPKGEFLYLFPFPYKGLCPVLALKSHLSSVSKRSLPSHLPLFCDDDGYIFTVDYVNIALKSLLKFRIDFRDHSISAHSFRAGLPSELQRMPSLLNSDEVRGWSRWNSDCISRYERLDSHQKEKIFQKISSALVTSL